MNAIVLSDKNLNIVWANSSLCALVDKPLAELQGSSFLLFLHEPEHGQLHDALKEALDAGHSVTHAVTFNPKDGNRSKRIRFTITPVVDAELDDVVIRIAQGDRLKIPSERKKANTNPSDAMQRAYRFSNLTLREGQQLFDRLEYLMREEQLFLDSNTSIKSLARTLHTNTAYISQIINFFADLTFPIYINYKRLNYLVAHLQRNPQDLRSKSWDLAGFGSYHAFYRFIKTTFGKTPRAYLEDKIAQVKSHEVGS